VKIQILGIGKVREPFYRDAIDDYLGRLGKHIKVESLETTREMSGSEADREAAYIKVRDKHLAATLRVALDERGRQMSSRQLADWLSRKRDEGTASISFILGGAHGLAKTAMEESDLVLGLSEMTLPHQMARLVLAEQLYRAFTIIKGEPYHK
jgi:23S rRNA (pseudouridine1915-N3)-methyltransferase